MGNSCTEKVMYAAKIVSVYLVDPFVLSYPSLSCVLNFLNLVCGRFGDAMWLNYLFLLLQSGPLVQQREFLILRDCSLVPFLGPDEMDSIFLTCYDTRNMF